ncbi:MAG: sortase [Bacilli bacterium]|nr:sortase [Bacilli bacterium]
MENLINKPNIKVTIGVLIVFIGICILSSNYYNQKKFEVFDEMNDLYYSQLIEIEDSDEIIEEEVIANNEEDLQPALPVINEVPNTPVPVIDYSKYYVGYLSIPKLDLKKGFTEIDNKYNNVNRNIEVIKPSDYPDKVKGNFIIAGHSGSSSVSFFKDLYKLNLEDEATITYNGIEYKYIIKNIYTDAKDGDLVIKRNKNKTTLTLITCTKGDKNTQTIYIAERD